MSVEALLAASEPLSAGWGVLFVLCLLIASSVWLGTVAQRVVERGAFMKGYFLGNRGLGAWALALTATVQSGGTFMGFPALVYRNGWVVALWISAYMVVPLSGFGVLAKRFAQLSRRTGAITVPDLFRERFGNSTIGLVSSLIILFSMTFMMVAQFKAGAIVMKIAWPGSGALSISEENVAAGFQDRYFYIGLIIFTLTVVGYTLIGGFLAAVWTDLFQSVLMWFGVMMLLPLSLAAVGGMSAASEHLRFELPVAKPTGAEYASLDPQLSETERLRALRTEKAKQFAVEIEQLQRLDPLLRQHASQQGGQLPATTDDLVSLSAFEYFGSGRTLHPLGSSQRDVIACTPPDKDGWRAVLYSNGVVKADKFGGAPGSLTSGPGPGNFLIPSLAISYFFIWVFTGLGSPAGAVRLMACKSTGTIRRSILLLGTYNLFIYIPLILICICARSLIPDLPIDNTDEIVPRMAVMTTSRFTGGSLITGLILTAPFGAVMATVSSYLVVISSGVVRDIYQRFINPAAMPHELKRLTYVAMILVGLIGLGLNVRPVQFLQTLVVFSSSCAGSAFVVPYLMTAYWRRATAPGAIAAMIAGIGTTLSLYLLGWMLEGKFAAYNLFGYDPIIWGLANSLVIGVTGSLLTNPPDDALIARMFDNDEPG